MKSGNWSDQLKWGVAWLKIHWFERERIKYLGTFNKGQRWMLTGQRDNGNKVGVAIIPRNHHNIDPTEIATIKSEYKVINELFGDHSVMERYVLLARTYKWEGNYWSNQAFQVLIPDCVCRKYIVDEERQIDIGFTSEQQQKWEKEGVRYTKFDTSRFTSTEALEIADSITTKLPKTEELPNPKKLDQEFITRINSKEISETEIAQIVKIRLGQSDFRNALINRVLFADWHKNLYLLLVTLSPGVSLMTVNA